MPEEIMPGLFRIEVPLPNSPLKRLNSYLFMAEDRELLVDTGYDYPECRETLSAALAELGSCMEKRDVAVTHFHTDHSGLAHMFAGPERQIYMSERDYSYRMENTAITATERNYPRFLAEGMPAEYLPAPAQRIPAQWAEMFGDGETRVRTLRDGDILTVGKYELETILVPGHTPGNIMFYLRKQEIMLCGDHVLFDITPNITAWDGVEDSLGEYLRQLKRAGDYSVRLALPGHRDRGEFRERIDSLLVHHAARLEEARQIVSANPGCTGNFVAAHLTWKIRADGWEHFPMSQRIFAMGECLSHLDHLLAEGKILRRTDENGIRHYEAADSKYT